MNKKFSENIEVNEKDEWILKSKDEKKVAYLKDGFWQKTSFSTYYCTIDIEKFYPSLKTKKILENIQNNVPWQSDDFMTLTSELLNFKIDCEGWSEEELQIIELDNKQKFYSSIPTGLIAAGFLSNVAMLHVDTEVSNKALNYQVAHFRYVDDHIILTKNFESLKKWIKFYRKLLKKELNLTLNIDKCTPKILFKQIDNKVPIGSSDVKKECLLDSSDPAPLLTQTISKISQLASIDFDLLDDNEQTAVLQDLEHLMLADFPDSEIPAATRISFASTLISRLAVKKVPSILEIANIKRSIFESGKGGNVDDLVKLLKEKEKYRSNVIFATRKRYFFLLLRAVHKHPDKIRLWKRLLDYAFNVGYKNLAPIGKELKSLNRSNALSTSYIRAYLYQIISKQIFSAILALSEPDIESIRLEEIVNYLISITRESWIHEEPKSVKFYEIKSLKNYIFAKSILRQKLNTELKMLKNPRVLQIVKNIEENEYIDFDSIAESDIDKNILHRVWWAEKSIFENFTSEPTSLWYFITRKTNPFDDGAKWLYYSFPAHISHQDFLSLLSIEKPNLQKYEGWIYEVLKGNQYLLDEINKIDGLNKCHDFSKYRFQVLSNGKCISLDEWCDFTHELYLQNPHDPRAGEWTALRLIQKIVKLFKSIKFKEKGIEDFLHPCNFLLDKKILSEPGDPLAHYTWESWKHILDTLEVSIKDTQSNNLVRDWRFRPKWTDKGNSQFLLSWTFMSGVSLLLIGLLRRGYNFPSLWNIHGHEPAWFGIDRNILKELNCSSWTTAIIESCLSPRSWENFQLGITQPTDHFEYSEGTPDTVPIYGMDDILKYINRSLEVLENGQISLSNHKPRQVVPIFVEQIMSNSGVQVEYEEDVNIG